MRAPFSEMLPVMRGVSILTRGEAAIAASRLTSAAEAGWLAAGALADGAARAGLRRGGLGVRPAARLCQFALGLLRARCFSICGML